MARKIDLSGFKFDDTCPNCGKDIHPSQMLRLDSERKRCPHCGGEYTVTPAKPWQQLHHG
jgi:hypothetical protein